MKKASVISIGTEILRGYTLDTNSNYIAKWFEGRGIKLEHITTADDSIDSIVQALKFCSKSDIIVLTGGLGPTKDDLTREAFSKFIGKKLIQDKIILTKIEQIFKRNNWVMSESNISQSYIVEGGEFIDNPNGTAPGIFFNDNNKLFFLLPGPPRENIPMINSSVNTILSNLNMFQKILFNKVYRLYNVGESNVADIFKNFNFEDYEIGYYFDQNGWVEIHISKYFNKNDNFDIITKSLLDKVKEVFDSENIFWTEDINLNEILFSFLDKQKLSISFGESITGGNLSGNLILNAGSSRITNGSIVAYSNDIKRKYLSVSEDSLKRFGAVSEEVAKEMVIGVKKMFNSNISVSVTGIAGPDGGSELKPIGLVYFGFLIEDILFVKKERFIGNRERIIKRVNNYVYCEILKYYHSIRN